METTGAVAVPSDRVAAQRALKNFPSKGVDSNFDPADDEQITAYCQLRKFSSRITAESFARAIKGANKY